MIIYTDLITGNVHSCTLMSSVPDGVTGYEVEAPEDKQYRGAWVINAGLLDFDMVKAKDLAHGKRRAKRQADFTPHDLVISLNIPAQDSERAAAETARVEIRTADAALQLAIDAAINIDELKAINF